MGEGAGTEDDDGEEGEADVDGVDEEGWWVGCVGRDPYGDDTPALEGLGVLVCVFRGCVATDG